MARRCPFDVLIVTPRTRPCPWDELIEILENIDENLDIAALFRSHNLLPEPPPHDLRAGAPRAGAPPVVDGTVSAEDLRAAEALARLGVRCLRSISAATAVAGGMALPPPFVGVQIRGDPEASVIRAARERLGPEALVGGSYHLPVRPLPAEADYAVVAPVFPPRSVPEKPPFGLSGLRRFAAARTVGRPPLVALGGIGPGRATACLAAGADAVAAITCFLGPVRTVRHDAPAVLAEVARARRSEPRVPP